MSNFEVTFAWEDPGIAKGSELRATWAQFKLTAEGIPITRVMDYRAMSLRDTLYLPLYPLAEWLAAHWWRLFFEVESPSRGPRNLYLRRHNLHWAREGYALPYLSILPRGRSVLLEWREKELPDCRLRFATSGAVEVELETLQSELARLIEATLQRLQEQGVLGTFLHDEWQSRQRLDEKEVAFCRTAAQLGLDPFDVSEDDSLAIVDAAAAVPAAISEEFFSIARPEQLRNQHIAIDDAIAQIASQDVELQSLLTLKAAMPAVDPSTAPWKVGYEFARRARRALGLNGDIVTTVDRLGEMLRVPANDWHAVQFPFRSDCAFVDAVVAVNPRNSPGFLIEKQREDSRKFALCRALFEYLASRAGSPALVSDARSNRQKRNRAFAAEFLVPAAELQRRMTANTISGEGVDELAAEFGTSSLVIRHQLANHRIAEVVTDT